MATPATIRVTELDFDTIKANFKTFLSASDEFKDYDFEASGMSILLDVLAYNTHYTAILANMVSNEMFLDTAAKRSSVISHAKSLGYSTRGIRSARAKVDVTINALTLSNGATAPDTFILPRGTTFLATVGNTQFQFVTIYDYSAEKSMTDTYVLNDVELVEGIYFSYEYIVNSTAIGVRYPIPNANADSSTIRMNMRQSVSDITPTAWNLSTTILNLDSTSKVFFVQENKDNLYEFYFGNGTLGALPEVGNLITVEYLSSRGFAANGARKFVPIGKLAHEGNGNIIAGSYKINLVQSAVGGANPESIEEIKHNASNTFITQDRAVTIDDYKTLIQKVFANIRSIKVWGGEDSIPVRYGKVIVCIQPQFGDVITQDEKDFISNYIKSKSIISVGLQFEDPEYLNIIVNSTSYYDPTILPKSVNLATNIKNVIDSYSSLQLEKFSSHFRFSKFQAEIDGTHEAINSSTTFVRAYKTLVPKLGVNQSYTINFYNRIASGTNTVTSSLFKLYGNDQWLRLYNVDSKLYAAYTNDVGRVVQVADAGTVNLDEGIITLNSVEFLAVYESILKIIVDPTSDDIEAGLNNIIRIQPEDASIKTVAELPNAARNLV